MIAYVDVSGSQTGVNTPDLSQYDKVVNFTHRILEEGEICHGGTDFNPVAQHILENNYKEVHIYSDGCGTLSDENAEAVKKSGCKVTSFLIGCDAFADVLRKLGPVGINVTKG